MRIAYVTPHYAPFVGGVETHVAEIAASLATMGIDVDVLTQESDRSLPATDVIRGVNVRRFAVPLASENFAVAPALASYLARHRHAYDVVHGHNYHSLPALLAAVTGCAPFVFTPHYHGTSESPFRRVLHVPYRQIARVLVARSQRVIFVSEGERALFTDDFPSARARSVVISNGVDISRIRESKAFDVDGKVLISVGRLVRYKNVERSIEALTCLNESFVLRVIGEGVARQELEAAASRFGVADRVTFLGRVDTESLYRWLRTAEAYISMSTIEAGGVTPLEALAAGAPVIASDIPAHREVAEVTSGDVTLVSANASAIQLADAIEAATARTTASANVPSWTDVARRTLDVYHTVSKRDER